MNCSEIYLEKRNNAKPASSPPQKKQMTKQQNIQDPKMKKMNVPETKMVWENEKRKNWKWRIYVNFHRQQQKVENAVYSLILFLVSSKKTLYLFRYGK